MKLKKILKLLLVLVITGFVILGINNLRTNQQQIQLRDVQLKERGAELKALELKYDHLNTELESADKSNKAEVEKLQKEKAELDAEKQRLEAELQAKLQRKEQERIAQAELRNKAVNTVTGTQTASALSGNKHTWLAQSGIPESEWHYVDSIVQRESGWNPNAVNKSSGACGLGQQLPCGKWAGAWNDPVAALVAQYGYVKGRYGSYAQAVAFWNVNHWY